MNESLKIATANLKNKVACATSFPKRRFTWLSNEEVASILIAHDRHAEWSTHVRVQRPDNGVILLFNRKEVKYRQDKYTWKTKKKSKFLREDRMKLKIGGVPYITATYVHSDILPNFHRRSYWLMSNPDTVLVHYLNYPYLEDGNHVLRDFTLNRHCEQWSGLTKDEVFNQLLPMFSQMPWPRQNSHALTAKGKELIVNHLIDQHFSERPCKPPSSHPSKNGYIQPKTPRKLLPYELINGPLIRTTTQPQIAPQPAVQQVQPAITLQLTNVDQPQQVLNIQPLEVVSVINGDQVLALNKNIIQVHQPAVHQSAVHQQPAVQDGADFITLDAYPVEPDQQYNEVLIKQPMDQPYNNIKSPAMDQQYSDIKSPTMDKQHDIKVDGGTVISAELAHNILCKEHVAMLQSSSTSTTTIVDNSTTNSTSTTSTHLSPSLILEATTPQQQPTEPTIIQTTNQQQQIEDEQIEGKNNLTTSPFPTATNDDEINNIFNCDNDNNSGSNTTADLNSSLLNGDTIFNQVLPSSSGDQHGVHDFSWDTLDADLESCLQDNATYEDVGYSSEVIDISDYSPDWAYTEGGIKVLLIGNWTRTGNYKCVFDQISVEAIKLQNGVLRCYCPGHPPGHVDLHVTYNGYIVSRKVTFEYKPLPTSYQDMSTQWLQLKDSEFKLSILERLTSVENRLNSFGSQSTASSNTTNQHQNGSGNNGGGTMSRSTINQLHDNSSISTEDNNSLLQQQIGRICNLINNLVIWNRRHVDIENILETLSGPNNISLIHIASGMGFIKLLHLMQRLWFEGENTFLQQQCHPNIVDAFQQTPLMYASGSGHQDCAELLYQWDFQQINCKDVIGRTAIGIAIANGHWHISHRLMSLPIEQANHVDDGISFETSSQDSGEFSMSTENDISLTDYEGGNTNTNAENGMEDIKYNNTTASTTNQQTNNQQSPHQQDINEFPMTDITNEKDGLAELAEQVIQASNKQVTTSYENDDVYTNTSSQQLLRHHDNTTTLQSTQTQLKNNNNVDNGEQQQTTTASDWSNFVALPAPNPHDIKRFFDLRASCLTDNEKYHLQHAAHTLLHTSRSIVCPDEENRASLVIKYCYSKYKEFNTVKKMNEAAVLIQSKFRSYQEQKRFQRSRHAAILIQSSYRNYKSTRKYLNNLRSRLAKKQQHQAAKKIQRFLRRCRHR